MRTIRRSNATNEKEQPEDHRDINTEIMREPGEWQEMFSLIPHENFLDQKARENPVSHFFVFMCNQGPRGQAEQKRWNLGILPSGRSIQPLCAREVRGLRSMI